MKGNLLKGAVLLIMLGMSVSSHAADPNLGRNLAAGCANCHGTDGRVVTGTLEINSLAGQPKEKIINKMNDYKSGEKPSTVMKQIALGYSDAQIAAIAAWFAAQPNSQ